MPNSASRPSPIEGKVAQILNRRELVINRGTADGVQKGMKFAVLNRKGVAIHDPDTGEPLGSLPIAKVVVEAARVEERLSVCRTFKQIRSPFDIFGVVPQGGRRFETLRSEDKPYQEELDESESYVKIGDPVIQAPEDEFVTE